MKFFPRPAKSVLLRNGNVKTILPPKSIYGATHVSLHTYANNLKLLWKTFHMFLTAWISDNRHICNCYLLIFISLYRISAKKRFHCRLVYVNTELMIYTTKPIKTTTRFQLRFVPKHVLHFWKPIFLLILQICKFLISCLIDLLPKQRNCEWFYSFQLCSQRHFVTLYCVTNSVTPRKQKLRRKTYEMT